MDHLRLRKSRPHWLAHTVFSDVYLLRFVAMHPLPDGSPFMP